MSKEIHNLSDLTCKIKPKYGFLEGDKIYFGAVVLEVGKHGDCLEDTILNRTNFYYALSLLGFNTDQRRQFAALFTGEPHADIFQPLTLGAQFYKLIERLLIVYQAKNSGRYFINPPKSYVPQLFDVVEISVGNNHPNIRFIVNPCHLLDIDVGPKEKGRIFDLLRIPDKHKFVSQVYGYEISKNNEFPLYLRNNFQSAARLIWKFQEVVKANESFDAATGHLQLSSGAKPLDDLKQTFTHEEVLRPQPLSPPIGLLCYLDFVYCKPVPMSNKRSILTVKQK